MHHIERQQENRHLTFDPENIVMVCQPCHSSVEGLSREAIYDIGGKLPPKKITIEKARLVCPALRMATRPRVGGWRYGSRRVKVSV